jgi:simple sugar transport system permease protein
MSMSDARQASAETESETRLQARLLGAVRIVFLLNPVWAVLLALLLGAILILLAGGNPIEGYGALFRGAFADYWGIGDTLVRMSPLLLAGLAVIIPLRAGLFNIGAEGQIYIGALAATIAALYLPAYLPGGLRILLCILVGALGGALWATIPGLLKAYRGTNEIITSLLLSYVAVNLVGAVLHVWLMEPGAPYPYSREVPDEVMLPIFMPRTQAHIGIMISWVAALLIAVMLWKTTLGQSIRVVGHNRHAAAYAGLNVRRLTVLSFAMGGSMGGLVGVFEVLGLRYRLFDHFSPGYGMQGIIVAFLAALNPIGAIFAAIFLGGLQVGAGAMQRATGIDTTMVAALQGLVVLCVALGLALKFHPDRWRRRIAAWRGTR